LFCTADAVLLGEALPYLLHPALKRLVAFSSTSVITKQDTEVASERAMIQRFAAAEQQIAAMCEQHGIGWTILRPTLIYAEGRDANITPLSRLIRDSASCHWSAAAPVCASPFMRRICDRRDRCCAA
jgi:nucleoside-diphosphate-sugar epimerase